MILKKFIAVALFVSIPISSNAYRIPIGVENNNSVSNSTATANNTNITLQQSKNDMPYYYPKDSNGHYVFTPKELWDNNPNHPPGPVLDFLTKPTKETGELYLDWLNQRNQALSKSFIVLEELKNQNFVNHIKQLQPVSSNIILIVYVSVEQASANQLLAIQQIKSVFPNIQIWIYPTGDPTAVKRLLYQYGLQNNIVQTEVVVNLAKVVSVVPSVYMFNKQTGNLVKAFAGGCDAKEIIQNM